MRGKHRVIVQNKRLHYEFEIKRNITIILGDSATGKTTLIDMLRQNMDLGTDSGIDVTCDVPCGVLEGRNWKAVLATYNNMIVFIDEGNRFINTEEFASAIKGSDNYYVLITRENLYNLPYSVDEIYGLHSSGKYQNTKKVYQEMHRIYTHDNHYSEKHDKLLVEDSNSGYDFFEGVTENHPFDCISAKGKSNIYSVLRNTPKEKSVCVIADGAALGAEMARLYQLALQRKNITFFLPESFEWLILKSGILASHDVQEALLTPEEFIDSKEFFSWEQFFTKLLIRETEGTPFQYNKARLNPVFLHERNKKKILEVMPKKIF